MNFGTAYPGIHLPYAPQPVAINNQRGYYSPGFPSNSNKIAERFGPIAQPRLYQQAYQQPPQQWRPSLMGTPPQPQQPGGNRLMGIGAIQPMRQQW